MPSVKKEGENLCLLKVETINGKGPEEGETVPFDYLTPLFHEKA